MDDLDIINLYFIRDEQAIKETDAKYGKLCYHIAYNILDNNEDSEECVNDTYIGLWNTIPPTVPNCFTAFISKITRNLSLKRIEFMSRQKRSSGIDLSFEELEAVLADENIADGFSDEDIGKIISDFLKNEKEDARNVFIRKYYFFYSNSDIAKRYGFSEGKIKSMLFRTRNRLKEFLIKEGVKI